MRLTTRLCNSLADCYVALRLFGLTDEQAERICREEATKAINAIPNKPYPDYKDQPNDHGNRNPLNPSNPE